MVGVSGREKGKGGGGAGRLDWAGADKGYAGLPPHSEMFPAATPSPSSSGSGMGPQSFHDEKIRRMVREAVLVPNGPPNEIRRWSPHDRAGLGGLYTVASVGNLELLSSSEEEDGDGED